VDEQLAKLTLHSTAKQASKLAQEVGVYQLFLNHISPRYKDPTVLLEEARSVFSNTVLPEDLSHYLILLDKKTKKPRIKTQK
ncbi:MAG: hypothetical protein ACW976_01445, partial [Candidatus Ranarchaeia archaeon]